ncbi:DNA endonuclease RBBP8 [Colossoma macropomum]|uniref:DNA endonuclease RBBP8 n=1 Tax=Colossoma macropomum TaxID=42526 RepID=UPI00186516AF|nr:DNA endonuclease RBBP8 [Colossoma macropomum]
MKMNCSQFSGTPADNEKLFQDLLDRLRECHDNVVQGLQSKVNKLKKERCLDAQKLEQFYNKNQQLREQQKTLQESVRALQDRLQSGPCDHCRESEKRMKTTQIESEHQNNLSLLKELKAERNILKEENRKLSLELERIRTHGLPQTSFSEPEEGMIPDSPLQSMSFPVASKLKRKKEQSHVRYAEQPLSQPLPDIRKRESMLSNCRGGDVLVPETCDLDVMCVTKNNTKINGRTVVAETCRLDLYYEDSENDTGSQTLMHSTARQAKREEDSAILSTTAGNTSIIVSKDHDSPSVLSGAAHDSREQKQIASGGSPCRKPLAHLSSSYNSNIFSHTEGGKRKHISVSPLSDGCVGAKEQLIRQNHDWPKSSKKQESHESKCWEPEEAKPDHLSPCTPCKSPLQCQNFSPYDQSWSLDPGAALSQYSTGISPHPEPRVQTETVDMDCTYVSHSMLARSRKQIGMDPTDSVTGIGQKANDSLANIFDTTGHGEYESCPQDEMSALEHDHVHENEEEEEKQGDECEKEEEEMEEEGIMEGDFQAPFPRAGDKPAGDAADKSFACVEVVRKKHERRKLQGHTCKECEIYYADLPEAERRKKLSSCSRHRFRYLPPSTPENFWEVGFPSTQTCVERGYIKEDDQPDQRLRRSRPYLATFSPKAKTSQK